MYSNGQSGKAAFVILIVRERYPFPKKAPPAFRNRWRRVYHSSLRWHFKKLAPIAFAHSGTIHHDSSGEETAISGGSHPYLWTCDNERIVMQNDSGKYVYVAPSTLSEDDIYRIKIATKGDLSAIEDDFMRCVTS